MTTRTFAALLVTAALSLAAPAVAQDHSGHGAPAAAPTASPGLPEICTSAAPADAAAMGSMGSAHAMDEAHTALMAGMDQMNSDMMAGAMAEDIDVAFVCGMIPHHRGAIDMARAELKYGDDQWAKDMAQKVIDAQEKEVAEMLDWLATQSK